MTETGIGLIAVVVAAVGLLLAVFRELAPAGGLTGRGQWLLAASLGAGIAAFAMKLVLIGLVSAAAPTTLLSWSGVMFPAKEPVATAPESMEFLPSRRYAWKALPAVAPSPPDNPATPAKEALGERLFFDRNLSLDRSVACASCHDLIDAAGADGLRTAVGIGGQRGRRNAPSVWNAAFQARLFWDGRASSLEEQSLGPLTNALEMGMPTSEAVVARVTEDPDYRQAFDAVFGEPQAISIEHITAAIAAYERTLITADSRYDRFVRGDASAMNAAELRGMARFEAVGCVQCHSGPNFSAAAILQQEAPYRIFPVVTTHLDQSLHLTEDAGLAEAGSEHGVWRVPSLRNVALTAPYFHNGSVRRLEDAIRIMARTQLGLWLEVDGVISPKTYWSQSGPVIVELRVLTERDVYDIAAFLRTLSSERLLAKR